MKLKREPLELCWKENKRKRELERKQRKEKEKILLQKREIESKLFGDPDDSLALLLHPFRQYYLQAEQSLPALIQIRHDWDQYLCHLIIPKASRFPKDGSFPCSPATTNGRLPLSCIRKDAPGVWSSQRSFQL